MLKVLSTLSINLVLGCISPVCPGGKHAAQSADKQL